MKNRRDEFLVELYKQMFNDINRHIMVVWQSVGVLVGAFAIFALVQKKVMPLDVAVSVMVILCGWLCMHLLDASYWYNRNLVIIANIERQFLNQSDLREIHYYFGKHRQGNKMITHLKIQMYLGLGLSLLVLLFHFYDRVLPGLKLSLCNFEISRVLPYTFALIFLFICIQVKKNRDQSYTEFIENSPGIDVDTASTKYGVGHGF